MSIFLHSRAWRWASGPLPGHWRSGRVREGEKGKRRGKGKKKERKAVPSAVAVPALRCPRRGADPPPPGPPVPVVRRSARCSARRDGAGAARPRRTRRGWKNRYLWYLRQPKIAERERERAVRIRALTSRGSAREDRVSPGSAGCSAFPPASILGCRPSPRQALTLSFALPLAPRCSPEVSALRQLGGGICGDSLPPPRDPGYRRGWSCGVGKWRCR